MDHDTSGMTHLADLRGVSLGLLAMLLFACDSGPGSSSGQVSPDVLEQGNAWTYDISLTQSMLDEDAVDTLAAMRGRMTVTDTDARLDDRTGLVCEIRDGHELIPRNILIAGSGDEKFKGFKAEWATLKGDQLIVGSHGKVGLDEAGNPTTGQQEWIKAIDSDYRVKSINWHNRYQAMREAVGFDATQGYLAHEAAEWHPHQQRWYFFPRKVSFDPFDEALDKRERGGNTLIVADSTFQNL